MSLEKYYYNLKNSLKINASPINSHDFPGKLILAKEVKKRGCKAIFGGDGADELFGGYNTYSEKIYNYKINNSEYSKYIKNNIKLTSASELSFKNNLAVLWTIVKSIPVSNKDESRQSMMLMDTAVQLFFVGLRGTDLMFMSNAIEPRSVF